MLYKKSHPDRMALHCNHFTYFNIAYSQNIYNSYIMERGTLES